MSELARQILRLPGVLDRISASPFSPEFKRGLRRAHIDMTFLRRKGFPQGAADLAGYRVRYCNFETFVYLFRELFLDGEYFFESPNPQPFILDCGSNIGMSILYFKARFPRAEVIGFEPEDAAYACLAENISANRLAGVAAHKAAVSGRDGEISFWKSAEKQGALGNTILPTESKTGMTVRSVKLSDFVTREVDFLKLDVEGAELEVLRELAGSGKLRKVRQMYVEYHLHLEPARDSDDFSSFLRLLEEGGFGYQLGAAAPRPLKGREFQGISLYAYNKSPAA